MGSILACLRAGGRRNAPNRGGSSTSTHNSTTTTRDSASGFRLVFIPKVGYALMLTDILAQHTRLLVTGNEALAERAFGQPARDGAIELPGVMSRKKQVAPRLLSAF